MRRVVKQQTGRKPPKRLKMAPLLLLMLACSKPPPRKPRGGRSPRENELLRRHGAAYIPAWLAAWRLGGARGWARHVFVDLDGHAPGCRWVRLVRWARP